MFVVKLILFSLAGFLVGYGLVLRVRKIMDRAASLDPTVMGHKNKDFWRSPSMGFFYRAMGVVILAYLIIIDKTQDLVVGLIAFFVSAIAIISWILLARRNSIR